MEYLSLGKIIDAFGLDGTLKIYSTTTNGELRYQKNAIVLLYNPSTKEHLESKVLNYRHSGLFDFVKLDIVSDKDNALSKKGYEIHVEKHSQDLPNNEYYFCDLKKCQLYDISGKLLGFVKEIEEFPAQITIRGGRSNGPDFFVPFINEFINNIDIENKRIVVNVIEGLL